MQFGHLSQSQSLRRYCSTSQFRISDLPQVKKSILNRREALARHLRFRNAITIETVADSMDEVRLAEERDLAMRILERDFADIRLVEAALERIERGTYGLCLRCDARISLNRLCVIPHAAFCVHCQDATERDGAAGFCFDEGMAGELAAS